MIAISSTKLNIIIDDCAHDDSLFKALSTINNQIGFNLKETVVVTVVSNQNINEDNLNLSILDKLNVKTISKLNWSIAKLNNLALNKSTSQWVTFMDSRDLLFADGSLLDFINVADNDNDVIALKYCVPVKAKNGKVINFNEFNYLNVIFGKYFKLSFLQANKINFNENLHYYLFDDFSSKALEMAIKPLWLNNVNYYLNHLTNFDKSFFEFCQYRMAFIKYMKKHNNDSDQVLKDITWSIVKAVQFLGDQKPDFSDQSLLKALYNTLPQNSDNLLKEEFQDQGMLVQYYRLLDLMGSDND